MRIAHDDLTISVNWESRFDRRMTPLRFTVSADIRSGYVIGVDANVYPRVDPVEFFEQNDLDQAGIPTNLRQACTQAPGVTFTAPRMQFQRPSGRFDEAMLFASAEGRWRAVEERLKRVYEDDIALGLALPQDAKQKLQQAEDKRLLLDKIRNRYFGLKDSDRDIRGSFNGSVVKPTDTKAAHLACLRDMLPRARSHGLASRKPPLSGPSHVFRDMIVEDLFGWFVISFDKEVSSPRSKTRIADFKADLEEFRKAERPKGGKDVPDYEMLERFCADGLSTAYHEDPNGTRTPYTIENFKSKLFPQIWIKSPVQHFGETEKVVGFPVLRKKYRGQMKRLAFDQEILAPDVPAAPARRPLKATIQPVSAFMNSMRLRTSPTERTGGNSARNGPAYINGAVFDPAVPIAILNICRI